MAGVCSSDGTHQLYARTTKTKHERHEACQVAVLRFEILYEAPDFPLAPSVAAESAHGSVFTLMTCF
jgi:hypothetical protein